jgi:hypothetical protein
MFKLEKVKVLHLEPTTTCQAACPQCSRTIYKSNLVPAELKLHNIQALLPEKFIKQLDKMFMCGNFGDPAAARDTLEIFKWFKAVNPSITLGMNTNGGIRHASWWADLAAVLTSPTDYVVFSIDGLEDTNHIYRIGVNWDNIMTNSASFINRGGNAHWDMLVYKHNEHQVSECTELAKSLGFKWFRSKVTRRLINVDFLELPSNTKINNVVKGKINCHALNEKSVLLNAQGKLLPCCFINDLTARSDFEIKSTLVLNNLDLFQHSLNEVISTFSVITDTWSDSVPYSECSKTCSTQAFTNQWKTEICLTTN